MKRRHTVLVSLVFDKPATRTFAEYEARQNLHGNFYTTPLFEPGKNAGQFRIAGVRLAPRNAPKRRLP